MRRLLPRIAIIVLAVAPLALNLAGCSDSGPGGALKQNQAPTVWLSSAPPEGTTSRYTIHLYWGGWDPDGEISHYEYSITDNVGNVFNPADTVGAGKWHSVVANDSFFTFTADVVADTNTTELVSEFTRSHTFFIRAVDEQGQVSTEPAYRSFTARTLSPEVNIQIPTQSGLNPALVPPITTFRWTARDYVDDLMTVQDPESVQYVIVPAPDGHQKAVDFLRSDPAAEELWEPWVNYKAPQDSGRFWTSPPLEEGAYVFAIRAKDEAGAVTPVLDESANLRRLRVSQRSSGPVFTVTNQYLGSVTTSVCNTPVVIMDLPAGVPVEFCWTASAEGYGGLVSGYRYGWDISDVSDPEQWETDYTPFTSERACAPPRAFFFGTHTFTAEVVDNSGYCSRIEVKVNIVRFTFSRNVALVDDYAPDENSTAGWQGSGNGIVPNDAEHDSFWGNALSRVAGFDPSADVIEASRGSVIPLTKVASYKAIIWNVFGDKSTTQADRLPLLYQYIQYRRQDGGGAGGNTGKRQPNLLSLFMAAGGRVMITGTHPVSNVVSRSLASGVKYPFNFIYEVNGSQEGTPDIDGRPGRSSYAYRDLCVDVLDFSLLPSNQQRSGSLNCPVLGQRGISDNLLRDHTMREAFPLDADFPTLTLRPEAAADGKAYNSSMRGLDAEIYNPQYFLDGCDYTPAASRDCFEPIYGLECFDTAEPIYHQPIAFWSSTFADVVPDEDEGGMPGRSVVFGFPLVFFNPEQVQGALDHVLFDEWQLDRQLGD